MSKLITHCGANHVSLDRLAASYTPPPERIGGSRPYVPIPHYELLTLVRNTAENFGLYIAEEQFALRDVGEMPDAEFFGLLRLVSKTTDFATMIGLRNSHSKTLVAGLCVGSYVFICDNLAFFGEIFVGRRHTKLILQDLPLLIQEAIVQVLELDEWQRIRYDAYKNAQVSDREAIEFLVDLHEIHDILPWSTVKSAIQEWRDPTFKEHANYGQSAWLLMNAVTEVLKPKQLRARVFGRGREPAATIWGNPEATIRLHQVLDTLVGIEEFVPSGTIEQNGQKPPPLVVPKTQIQTPAKVNSKGKLAPPRPGQIR